MTDAAPTRPVLRWHGSKWRIAPWVISHFPAHRIYLEPFGGGAGVLLRKPRSETEIYNDLDGDVVNLFRVLRDRPDDLARAIALTPYARDEYDGLYREREDPVDRARALIARSFMGTSSKGALEKSGFDTRINPDGYISRLRSLLSVPDQVFAIADRLARVVIENGDAVALIRRHDRADCLIYLDPPYVPEKRGGKYYRHEMDRSAHRRLLEAARDLAAMVIISGYPSELYDTSLTGWRRATLAARTDGAHERTEVLWINPACAAALDRETAHPQLPGLIAAM